MGKVRINMKGITKIYAATNNTGVSSEKKKCPKNLNKAVAPNQTKNPQVRKNIFSHSPFEV
jgi:hypothetical protein